MVEPECRSCLLDGNALLPHKPQRADPCCLGQGLVASHLIQRQARPLNLERHRLLALPACQYIDHPPVLFTQCPSRLDRNTPTRPAHSFGDHLPCQEDLCRVRTGQTAPFPGMREVLCAELRLPKIHVGAATHHLQRTILAISSPQVFPSLGIEINGEQFLIA